MLIELKRQYDAIVPGHKVDASFSFEHVILALLAFDMHGKLGRTSLARLLDIGRGSLRTFFSRVRDGLGLVQTGSTRAHALTPRGLEVVNAIKGEITLIGNLPSIFSEFTISTCNASVRVARPALGDDGARAIDPVHLVSVARAAGGDGLLSIIVEPGRVLELVAVQLDVKRRYTREWMKLNEIFPLQPGDVILIASATTENIAKRSALAAAIELVAGVAGTPGKERDK